ncbi:hypothetical protein BB561_005424 [Smittium simulii]|uniref:Uncharacterized protein n=1 Tax=Smittium simulii TaxID=133385 RepID=A0A2T9YAK9_9FUNG|nr:hypothetical protein BB561_005424 [Smittium simulii]
MYSDNHRQKQNEDKLCTENTSFKTLTKTLIDPGLQIINATKRKVVLVDPLDSKAKHCSVVPFTDLALLDQASSFFLDFKNRLGDAFTADKGIKTALEYLNNGIIPPGLMWPKWESQNNEDILITDNVFSEPKLNELKKAKVKHAIPKSKINNNKNTKNTKNLKYNNNSPALSTSPSSTSSSKSFDPADNNKLISEIEQEMAGLHHDYKRVLIITSQLAKEIWLLERKTLPSGLALTRQGKKRKYL